MLPEEIKFLMQLYDSLTIANALENMSPIERKNEYKNKITKLLEDEQISKEAFDIACRIYSMTPVQTTYISQLSSSTRSSSGLVTTYLGDPCGHNSSYSGRSRGGC